MTRDNLVEPQQKDRPEVKHDAEQVRGHQRGDRGAAPRGAHQRERADLQAGEEERVKAGGERAGGHAAEGVGDGGERHREEEKGEHRHEAAEVFLQDDGPRAQVREKEQHQRVALLFLRDAPAHHRRQKERDADELEHEDALKHPAPRAHDRQRIVRPAPQPPRSHRRKNREQRRAIDHPQHISPPPRRRLRQLLREQWE